MVKLKRLALAVSTIFIANTYAATSHACLWDRDTLAAEAKGLHTLVHAIIGWYDTYPPQYYQMRLSRIEKEIKTSPDDLNLYDDAAVAANRLHRYRTAIKWMKKKYHRMILITRTTRAAKATKSKEQTAVFRPPTNAKVTHDDWYRYYANFGTFCAHAYLAKPKERPRKLIHYARRQIARALEINPQAHFGRERYQLRAIDWLIKVTDPNYTPKKTPAYPTFLDIPNDNRRIERHLRKLYKKGSIASTDDARLPNGDLTTDAQAALAGLITLGDAWRSVDVFSTLTLLLMYDGRNALAYLAAQRLRVLRKHYQSLSPDPQPRHELPPLTDPSITKSLEKWYKDAFLKAKERTIRRYLFMGNQFKKGKHPDTHPDFWNGYQDPTLPKMPQK